MGTYQVPDLSLPEVEAEISVLKGLCDLVDNPIYTNSTPLLSTQTSTCSTFSASVTNSSNTSTPRTTNSSCGTFKKTRRGRRGGRKTQLRRAAAIAAGRPKHGRLLTIPINNPNNMFFIRYRSPELEQYMPQWPPLKLTKGMNEWWLTVFFCFFYALFFPLFGFAFLSFPLNGALVIEPPIRSTFTWFILSMHPSQLIINYCQERDYLFFKICRLNGSCLFICLLWVIVQVLTPLINYPKRICAFYCVKLRTWSQTDCLITFCYFFSPLDLRGNVWVTFSYWEPSSLCLPHGVASIRLTGTLLVMEFQSRGVSGLPPF